MANFVYNIAKGRGVELYKRVEGNDPAGSELVLVPLSASGTEAEGQDYDTLSAVLGGTANEQTAGGWVRKDLTDTELATDSPNDTDNRYDVAVPEVTWTGPTAGNNTTGLLVCYDSTGSAADTAIVPITHHDFAVTADGNDVVLNAGDFLRCS